MVFESCIVECFLPNNEKILIAVIYRPPSSSMADFIDKFENMLSVISNLRMPFFILGDFNIDLMGCLPSSLQRIDRHVLQFLECNLSHGMSQYVLFRHELQIHLFHWLITFLHLIHVRLHSWLWKIRLIIVF